MNQRNDDMTKLRTAYTVIAVKCQDCDNLENVKISGDWSSEDLVEQCGKCGQGPRVCIGLVGEYI